MPISTASTPAPVPVHRKSSARVALFDLPEAAAQLMTECFRQSGIETASITLEQADRLQREKFEACVLPLNDAAGSIIELARGSASNARIIIYGLGGTAQDAMRYSKLCLNAVFHEPLERSAAMKLVRSTRMLVLHEFRRYVRVPVMTEVGIVLADGGRMTATSHEISSGGMSFTESLSAWNVLTFLHSLSVSASPHSVFSRCQMAEYSKASSSLSIISLGMRSLTAR